MLKKTILLTLLLGFSSLTFAKNLDVILIVTPDKPLEWRYINATVSVNHVSYLINNHITLHIKQNDLVSLTDIIAMNGIRPKIDDSCHLKIQEESTHQLFFELQGDWRIYCRYS